METKGETMRTRPLGASGLDVSLAGLGTNAFGRRIDLGQSRRVVDAALDSGITFFDTADVYGDGDSERFLGEALRGRRDRAVIATKFGMPMGEHRAALGRRDYVLSACDRSLERLGVDVIDLYQMHAPDPDTPLEETLEALDHLVTSGKVRHVGCSNFSGDLIVQAAAIAARDARMPFVSAQNHWNLFERAVERDVIPACERESMGVLPYFPLAGGLLTGKYRRGQAPPAGSRFASDARFQEQLTDERFDQLDRLQAIAVERGVSLAATGLAWLAAQPMVASVIAGATRPEQVAENVAATLWEPDAATLEAIDAVTADGVRA
jgi:aryl-alcohol dehydrogenase-like predicted oxidoreductase